MTITDLPNAMVRMAGGAWSQVVPRADLPKWLTIYIGLRDRGATKTNPGPYHRFYADDVTAIERAMKDMG